MNEFSKQNKYHFASGRKKSKNSIKSMLITVNFHFHTIQDQQKQIFH